MLLHIKPGVFERLFAQRCFFLFSALLLLIVLAPSLTGTLSGRIVVNGINVFILVAAIAAVGRSRVSLVIGVLLAVPTVGFQLLSFQSSDASYLALSWAFGGAFYFAVIIYLLDYVFSREVMSADKLYGAASAYLMVGVVWIYLYALAQYFFPGSFSTGSGVAPTLNAADLIYFSFTVLTTTGFGDIAPALPLARTLVTLEQVTGTLFVAILIARLAGLYPSEEEKK